MSAIEVIEQIKLLPREEQEKVAAFLDGVTDGTLKPEGRVSDQFKSLADEVFTTNTELFRKLAQ